MGELQPIFLAVVVISGVGALSYHEFVRKELEKRKIEALERIAAALEKRP